MAPIVEKLQPEGPGGPRVFTVDRDVVLRVEARSSGGSQKKRAEVWSESRGKLGTRWAITCDEGIYLGGEDSAPAPLVYFAAGVAF